MDFKAAKCTECGGALQVPDDREQIKCMYCGASIVVKKAIQAAGIDPSNYMQLAEAAAVAGNPDEAYAYFNKVLEVQPQNAKAWFGKGKAAGWASTLKQFRVSEMQVCFENAVKRCDPAQQAEMKKECARTINEVATAVYGMARKHMLEFIALPRTWAEYLPRCREIIAAYQMAHELDPENRTYIENVVHVCSDNIEGVRYNDPYQNNISKSVFLSPEYEAEIRKVLTLYAEKMKKLDPSYVAPNPQKKDPGCFVITASLGDANHPSVRILRAYRDQVLEKSLLGRAVTKFYYRVGPKAATLINSPSRRVAAQRWIVRPAVRAASRALAREAIKTRGENDAAS